MGGWVDGWVGGWVRGWVGGCVCGGGGLGRGAKVQEAAGTGGRQSVRWCQVCGACREREGGRGGKWRSVAGDAGRCVCGRGGGQWDMGSTGCKSDLQGAKDEGVSVGWWWWCWSGSADQCNMCDSVSAVGVCRACSGGRGGAVPPKQRPPKSRLRSSYPVQLWWTSCKHTMRSGVSLVADSHCWQFLIPHVADCDCCQLLTSL
jgi:hypothetical protein